MSLVLIAIGVLLLIDLVIASLIESSDDISTPYFWSVLLTVIAGILLWWGHGDDVKSLLGITQWSVIGAAKVALFYVGVGTVFSFVKWYLHVRRHAESLITHRAKATRLINGSFEIPSELAECLWHEPLTKHGYSSASRDDIKQAFNESSPQLQAKAREIAIRNHVLAEFTIGHFTHLKGRDAYKALVPAAKIEFLLDDARYKQALELRALDNKDRVSYWIIFWPLSMISTFFHEFIVNLAERVLKVFRGVYRSIGQLAMRDVLTDEK